MKAASFEYSRVADVDEACAILASDESARVIAGGQTLVPMMVMRLARPTRLVDIIASLNSRISAQAAT
jgi:CO/xanthine dehydrogenase FAD-binding subunit